MTLAWVSDPHLDRAAPERVAAFHESLRRNAGNPVILTGDLSNASRLVSDLKHLVEAADRPIYFVLGNHDHYGAGVGAVRDAVLALGEEDSRLRWLPPAGVVDLGKGRLLVGVDGWADGRHGDPIHTPLVLNDDRLIAELADQPTRATRLAVKRILADADAARLETLLDRAAERRPDVIVVATHVPPFVAALRPGSRESHPDWHPLLVCGATGEVLERFAGRHPAIRIRVLAGHTHRAADVRVAPNLRVTVAEARYGHPAVGVLEDGG